MRALEHDGPWTSLVTPDRRRGWVYLYDIGTQSNEIASFSGAMISYYRGDYDQAARLFATVGRTTSANAVVQQDAAALRAASLSRSGLPAAPAIDAVRQADPYAVYPLQVAIMDVLSSSYPSHRARALATELQSKIGLFDVDDPWPRRALALLEAAK